MSDASARGGRWRRTVSCGASQPRAPQAAALLSAALGEAITPTDIVAAIAASYPGDPRRTFTVSGGRGLVVQAGDRVVVVTRNDRTVH